MGPCTANARRPTVDSRCRGTTISCYVADLRLCGIRVWCFTENGADGDRHLSFACVPPDGPT